MGETVGIRPLEDCDVAAVIDLWQACGLTRPWNDPASDIDLARKAPSSEILVAVNNDKVVASAMTGFDGHRGWCYYVATHPDHRGSGLGAKIMAAAEDWLRERGCPKVEVIMRSENTAVARFYEGLDYVHEPRSLMSKWLITPPAAHGDSDPKLNVTITWLEMLARPTRPARPLPRLDRPVALTRLHQPTAGFFRYLYNSVGEPWMWWEKRIASDAEIDNAINAPGSEIYLLSVGGVPAGFAQLTFAPSFTDGAEVTYFGLLPDFIGMGLGPYLLDWAVHTCWDHPSAPARIELNTCTLDHPAALTTYQKAGFTPFKQETIQITDPRARGIIPSHIELAQPQPVFNG